MLIFCSDGTVREMTEEEEYIAEHLPNPADMAGADELLDILTGGGE